MFFRLVGKPGFPPWIVRRYEFGTEVGGMIIIIDGMDLEMALYAIHRVREILVFYVHRKVAHKEKIGDQFVTLIKGPKFCR